MSLSLRKRTRLAAGVVSIMAVCVLSPLEAIAGGAGVGNVAGGAGGTKASLSYDPFAGDVVGEVESPELEGFQLTASAANADPGILDRLAVRISSWYSSAKNFIKDAFVAPPEFKDQSKVNIIVDVLSEPPLGTPPEIAFPLMVAEAYIAVDELLLQLTDKHKFLLDDTIRGVATIDEAVGSLHNKSFIGIGNWQNIVDLLKPDNEYSLNEKYTELVRIVVIRRAEEIKPKLLEQ